MAEELDVTEVVKAVELVSDGYRSSTWLFRDGRVRRAIPATAGRWSKRPQAEIETAGRQSA